MNLRRFLLCILPLVAAALAACQSATDTPAVRFNPALRDELLAMEARDQEVRTGPASNRPEDKARMDRWREVDAANLARFRQILDEHGWPTRNLVGSDGARAAWVLAQHADSDIAFQRRCLELMRNAHILGLAPGPAVAYLTDRVLMNEGRPQIYGTQFTSLDGDPVPYQIESVAGLDERRARMGLPPMAEYERLVKETLAKSRTERP